MTPQQLELINSIEVRNTEKAKELIAVMTDFDFQDEKNGFSPLHYAVKFENKAALELLLTKKININIQDNYNNTPLHLAIAGYQDDYAKLLMTNKEKVNSQIQNKDGDTVLHALAKRGAQSGTTILSGFGKALESCVYIQNNAHETPIHCCISYDNLHMFFFYLDQLRNPYYNQINLDHPNLIKGPNSDGLAHTIIRRLQQTNWPDNEARTFQMLYLLAGMSPNSFTVRNDSGILRGVTPIELVKLFPTATARISDVIQRAHEIHRTIFGTKLAIGVLQENATKVNLEQTKLKSELAKTNKELDELKTEFSDVKKQLSAMIKLLKPDTKNTEEENPKRAFFEKDK